MSSYEELSLEEAQPEDSGRNKQKSGGMAQTSGFGSVFHSILKAEVKEEGSGAPVLAKARHYEGQLKRERFEESVERRVVQDRAALRERWCVQPDPHVAVDLEKTMKKIATRGVVKLFNAINKQQQMFRGEVNDKTSMESKNFQKMSKKAFLGLLKGESLPKQLTAEQAKQMLDVKATSELSKKQRQKRQREAAGASDASVLAAPYQFPKTRIKTEKVEDGNEVDLSRFEGDEDEEGYTAMAQMPAPLDDSDGDDAKGKQGASWLQDDYATKGATKRWKEDDDVMGSDEQGDGEMPFKRVEQREDDYQDLF